MTNRLSDKELRRRLATLPPHLLVRGRTAVRVGIPTKEVRSWGITREQWAALRLEYRLSPAYKYEQAVERAKKRAEAAAPLDPLAE